MIEYELVIENHSEDLVEAVNKRLAEGWQLAPGFFVRTWEEEVPRKCYKESGLVYYQPMIREKE